MDCLNTKAARIVYKIFTQNSIEASLTFHGGDNVIGYPWGSYNWSKKGSNNHYHGYLTPDYHSFKMVAQKLQNKARSVEFDHSST